jgi:nicotinate-nucleotide pyrophosphorylase (carboxylating)
MLTDAYIGKIIQQALKEDIGTRDITTSSVLHKAKNGGFVIIARQEAIVCGMHITEAVFESVDSSVRFKPLVSDGARVVEGKAIAYIEGPCSSVLAAERTALNFISWLSGTATFTDRFVEQVRHTKARIMDTRKTIPTLRRLQRYAIKTGGGTNHRMGLYDQVLIKDNHISLALSRPTVIEDRAKAIAELLKNARANAGKGSIIEIEIDSLDMLDTALIHNPDIIMLDNMSIGDIKRSIAARDTHRQRLGDIGINILLEVYGNINLGNIRQIAECGVDRISVGALTHSAPAADFSLEVR